MAGKIRAAIFDMDGTLVDNMHFHQQAWFSFLEDQGLNVTLEEYHAKNAGILPEIMARFFPEVTDLEALYALGRKKEEKYQEIYRPHIKALPGLEVAWFGDGNNVLNSIVIVKGSTQVGRKVSDLTKYKTLYNTSDVPQQYFYRNWRTSSPVRSSFSTSRSSLSTSPSTSWSPSTLCSQIRRRTSS
jgi:hypothetical protein